MGFSLPPLPEEPEAKNSNSFGEQSLQQENLLLLEQQTTKIHDLEKQLKMQEDENKYLKESLNKAEQTYALNLRTLQNELDIANARANGTTSSADREHAWQVQALRAEMKAAVEAEKRSARKAVKNAHQWLYVVIGYGILLTLFTAISRRSFGAACQEFVWVIADDVWPGVYLALQAPARLAHLADGIPDEIWSSITYWAVLIAECGATCLGIHWCAVKVRQFSRFYQARLADWISLSVFLASLAVAVFFAGPLRVFGVNAVLMILIVNAVYIIMRSIRIQRYR